MTWAAKPKSCIPEQTHTRAAVREVQLLWHQSNSGRLPAQPGRVGQLWRGDLPCLCSHCILVTDLRRVVPPGLLLRLLCKAVCSSMDCTCARSALHCLGSSNQHHGCAVPQAGRRSLGAQQDDDRLQLPLHGRARAGGSPCDQPVRPAAWPASCLCCSRSCACTCKICFL